MKQQTLQFKGRQPVVWAYGGGRDSTAGLIESVRLGWRPDAILMADVGSEKRGTYEFLPVFDRWLRARKFPGITMVRYQPVSAPYRSLEGNMVLNATLPGATFNRGSCTHKFKIGPQNAWTRRWPLAQAAWAANVRVLKLIGFEFDEGYRLTRANDKAHAADDDRYECRYPLMEWKLTLPECVEIIQRAGLPVPPKSACYFCPNMKPDEVRTLSPEDRGRVMLMELVAEPYNRIVRGLWRRPRKKDGRPGSITEFVLREKLPFSPLTSFGGRVVLNAKCKKAADGHTFDGPHVGPSLREQLVAEGHAVPEVVTHGEPGYREDCRCSALEAASSADAVDSL